ncbi:MAG: T9SS type A sorting domain-containing protein, partial [Bacteroidota bacterium]
TQAWGVAPLLTGACGDRGYLRYQGTDLNETRFGGLGGPPLLEWEVTMPPVPLVWPAGAVLEELIATNDDGGACANDGYVAYLRGSNAGGFLNSRLLKYSRSGGTLFPEWQFEVADIQDVGQYQPNRIVALYRSPGPGMTIASIAYSGGVITSGDGYELAGLPTANYTTGSVIEIAPGRFYFAVLEQGTNPSIVLGTYNANSGLRGYVTLSFSGALSPTERSLLNHVSLDATATNEIVLALGANIYSPAGKVDPIVAKFSPSLALQWCKQFHPVLPANASTHDQATMENVRVDQEDDIVLCGDLFYIPNPAIDSTMAYVGKLLNDGSSCGATDIVPTLGTFTTGWVITNDLPLFGGWTFPVVAGAPLSPAPAVTATPDVEACCFLDVDYTVTADCGTGTGSVQITDISGGKNLPMSSHTFTIIDPGYTYGGNTPSFANLAAGTYTIRVEEGVISGVTPCAAEIEVTIPGPMVCPLIPDVYYCAAEVPVTVNATPNDPGLYSWQWSGPGTISYPNDPTGTVPQQHNLASITPVGDDTYTVTITNDFTGCSCETTFEVRERVLDLGEQLTVCYADAASFSIDVPTNNNTFNVASASWLTREVATGTTVHSSTSLTYFPFNFAGASLGTQYELELTVNTDHCTLTDVVPIQLVFCPGPCCLGDPVVPPPTCPPSAPQVCGCDNVTYTNRCDAEGTGVAVYRTGFCLNDCNLLGGFIPTVTNNILQLWDDVDAGGSLNYVVDYDFGNGITQTGIGPNTTTIVGYGAVGTYLVEQTVVFNPGGPGICVASYCEEIEILTLGKRGEAELVARISDHPIKMGAYPNPITSALNVRFAAPESGPATVELHNSLGQLVQQHQLTYGGGEAVVEHQFDATNLDAGIYYVKLKLNGQERVIKVMK